ncbi:MAG TPA: TetR/AcrR family transcriptional regulator [Acidobacteriaceae bacterium]|jgi:AcrR family transcriptional regulator
MHKLNSRETDRAISTKRTASRNPKVNAPAVRTRLDAEVRSRMIVEAAFTAIAKDGFEGLRTRDIARLVGINSATLHHHFPTKENLIAAVAHHLESRFRTETTQALDSQRAVSPLERQFNDAIFYYKHRPEILAVYREFVGRAPRDPAIRKLLQQLHRSWHADVVATLRKGMSAGLLRDDLVPDAAAGVIISTVWGLIAHVFPSSDSFDAGFHELTRWIAADRAKKEPRKTRPARTLKAL